MSLFHSCLASSGLPVLLALAASVADAQQTVTQNELRTQGACSPGIINNAGLITINCGPDSQLLLKTLNELLTSNTRSQLLPALQKMNRELEALSQLAPRREAFGEALARGELKAVKRLLAQGVTPYEEYQGRYAMEGFFANARNLKKSAEIFDLLLKYGLDVDRQLDERLSGEKSTVTEHVLETRSEKLFRLLWDASRDKEGIRELVLDRLIRAQQAQRRTHAATPRPNEDSEQALLAMWRIAAPEEPFSVSLDQVRFETGVTGRVSPGTAYDGPDGCFLLLKTTSLLRSVSYEMGGKRRKVEWSTRLPINEEELLRPETPIRLEATDAVGRRVGPITITVDIEHVRC